MALGARADLARYGSNSRLLFALEVRFDIEDIHTVAANALTDGYNDKKCDLLYVDRDNSLAVIAQGYEAQKKKKAAKATKASDLNTAVSWILGRDVDDLPEALQSAAQELQSAMDAGEISKIHVWYVHNLPQSVNVEKELKTVQSTAKKLIKSEAKWRAVDVEVVEVGNERLQEWYSTRNNTIKVDGQISLPVTQGYELSSSDQSWHAFVTVVPLSWLRELFLQYKGELLFSANIRNYLGVVKSDNDINSGIKTTATNEPEHFWAYNNGLTILTRGFQHDSEGKLLTVNGLSIVNGAQTTGVVGNLDQNPGPNAVVQVRFISTSNRDLIRSIIKFNNSQNKVKSSDFRSDDATQHRLRSEFHKRYKGVIYLGGRRGGDSDARARHRESENLASDTVAQALTAFRGRPVVAYSRKGQIWEDNKWYEDIFNQRTTAGHILFVFGLLRSVEKLKSELQSKDDERTDLQQRAHRFLGHRGAIYVFVSAIAACKDELAGRRVVDTFDLSFKERVDTIQKAVDTWTPVVELAISALSTLQPAVEKDRLREEVVTDAITGFLGFFGALKSANPKVFADFAKNVATPE